MYIQAPSTIQVVFHYPLLYAPLFCIRRVLVRRLTLKTPRPHIPALTYLPPPQVVFPLLMFVYVSRIVWSRVRPDHSPLRFEPNPNAGKGCFLAKFCG